MYQIALNADVGEEVGNDHLLMPYLSWCNIACGAHAGSEKVIEETIALAQEYDVKIGAHPSYPDRKNFGRRSMKLTYHDLAKSISQQILLVKEKVEKVGGVLHHVKPHGALYNDAVKNEGVARVVLDSVKNVAKGSSLLVPCKSVISYVCEGQIDLKYETFSDRNYNTDLSLVSRSQSNAVLKNEALILEHVKKMIFEKKIKTIMGEELPVFCDTICVHGDHPESPKIVRFLYEELERLDVVIL